MPQDTFLAGYADDIAAIISARTEEEAERKLRQVIIRSQRDMRESKQGKKSKFSTRSPTNISFENYVRIPHIIGSRCPRHSRSGANRSNH